MNRLEKKLSSCLESGDYYEANQIYRTLYHRMSSQGKWHELQDLLYNGAIKLLDVNEPTSAIDLAELFIESLQKSNMPVSSSLLDRFEQLFTRLPPLLEKETSTGGSRMDRRNEFLSRALKWTMAVGEKKRHREKGHPDFHARVAKVLWHENKYVAARNHFFLSNDSEGFASFLIDFQQHCGFKSEKDLFIAQAVLQVLCSRRSKMACVMLQLYCEKHPEIASEAPYQLPLLNFVWLLTLCVQLRNVTYFSIIVEQYQKCLERDPSYRDYLDKIGQIYFGLPPPQESMSSGLFGTLLKGLLGSNEPTGSSFADDSDSDDDLDNSASFMDANDDDSDRVGATRSTAHSASASSNSTSHFKSSSSQPPKKTEPNDSKGPQTSAEMNFDMDLD
ncbi:unnamed protein product [Anisakis simplex]|uniref:Golgi to ER traffic protein 4 homolog (inferred by orthology to a human protein) n=1 Tax=Anisakis simplex TaxID=6269 RepID=A0A0M3K2T4_ANISI|nr:unnamed protein product [Anisakis simplex]